MISVFLLFVFFPLAEFFSLYICCLFLWITFCYFLSAFSFTSVNYLQNFLFAQPTVTKQIVKNVKERSKRLKFCMQPGSERLHTACTLYNLRRIHVYKYARMMMTMRRLLSLLNFIGAFGRMSLTMVL